MPFHPFLHPSSNQSGNRSTNLRADTVPVVRSVPASRDSRTASTRTENRHHKQTSTNQTAKTKATLATPEQTVPYLHPKLISSPKPVQPITISHPLLQLDATRCDATQTIRYGSTKLPPPNMPPLNDFFIRLTS
ncbi:hypothetical protein L873DRAFT_1816561 [Choiromyces venosus 120613-1]|uniref:Uncharacterized protein n=1 Tax=Choiromyces venosus 120613-1 TaxID=1336337 RepID=A0A3N4J479_9PEZI|nr:hypothetical protein L873DRAFT_1816561 [Choiromyces venosus 120613-1]